ncbi:patched domain-containing 2, partial [Paramuricea clavata]
MPFSRDSYSRLESPIKYGCDETDALCGLQQTNQTDGEDDDLVGYSLDFAEPKHSFVGHVKQSCRNVGRKFMSGLHFVLKVAFGKWPIALIILISYIGLTVGLIVVALTGRYREFRKDISLDSFMVPDIKVSSDFAAFNAAKKQGKSNSPYSFQMFLNIGTCTGNKINPQPRKIPGRLKRSVEGTNFQGKLSWTLDLVYVSKGGDNIFTKKRLREIHDIENSLMKHKNYDKHCYISPQIFMKDEALKKYGNCTPPNSMTNYFYSRGKIYDGQNEELSRPINETLQFLKSKEYFFSYVSDDFSKKDSSNILRAQILFGRPVQGVPFQTSAQKEEFKRFVTTYVDALDELNNNNQVSILYGGGDLFDYLVDNALSSDIRLAAISLGLVILLLIILTFSWWLSLMAVITIMCSVAKAYFFYRVVFGIQYMGILNGVSLFVIIGIGVDDIFVFINTFRQAVDNKDLGSRICHTIYVAGKATFFTSFTTAAAFGANALSPIPAIHDFGLFMSILVSSCWVSVLFIMPPSLTLWHAGIEKLESAMCNRVLSAIGFRRSESLRLPNDIRRFLSGIRNNECHESEHEAIPLVSNNNDDVDDDDDDDEPLLLLDNESTSNQDIQATDSIGFRLQSILYHFVAEPVIKGRVVIFMVYLVILIGSAFLVTKLQVSTEQPKFFKADSNLQRWLELPDVSLKMSGDMLKDLTDIPKQQLPKIPSRTPPITTRPKHTQPRTKTRKVRTPVPQRPTIKPPTTRFKSTEPKTPKLPSTRDPTVTTKKAVVTNALTTPEEETTFPSVAPTEYIEPTHTSKTTNKPRWVTTSANNSSTSSCPHHCIKGRCNTTTHKCDCHLSYTGETCSIYCPVKTMTGECCYIPFKHERKWRYGCLIDTATGKPWCSLTPYNKDGVKEECNKTVA